MSVRSDVLAFLRDPQLFIESATDSALWLDGLDAFALPSIAANADRELRAGQEAAWRGLADRRAGLILGPPGTGKTHILSWLIAGFRHSRRRAGRSSRVLVTAFTRNAIGNVIDAVATRQQTHDPSASPAIYFGDPPAAGLAPGVNVIGRRDADDIVATIGGGDCVVGMTVWSLYRLLTTKQFPDGDGQTAPLFDLICIDEASQLVLGHGLMALAGLAQDGRVVVAGDDQQLPPIRAGRSVLLEGRELGGSLYAFMKSVGAPEFALDETFRLNEPLTVFPERSFYPGRYVSRSARQIDLRENWQEGLDLLARTALNPDIPLVVLVHDGPAAATMNPFEVQLATGLSEALAHRFATPDGGVPSDLWQKRLAIVSPHRAQNAAIRANLPSTLKLNAFVETVDRVQGKEREAIILSYCVADPEFALTEGEFIFSPERLNVATTRAESKLIVIVSRRLLEAVPSDQDVLDKAELLREFVFSCPEIARTTALDASGRAIAVEIRGRAFNDREPALDLTPDPPVAPTASLAMTPLANGVLETIRRVASENPRYGNAPLDRVRRQMALPVEPIGEAALLHRMGWISLAERRGKNGSFFTAQHFDSQRIVWPIDEATVRAKIDLAIREARRGRHTFYDQVKDRFAWMDDAGCDILLPVMRRLEDEGMIVFGTAGEGGVTVEMRQTEADVAEPNREPLPALSDDDFRVLNRLEDIDAKRINFGVFDSWTSTVELATSLSLPIDQTAAALSRLQANGYLMLADEGRVRSRMGELARELKHVKQRFRRNDAGQRPYLIRSLKIELQDRAKPQRNIPVKEAFERAARKATASQRTALDALQRMLARDWGDGAMLAEFQVRGLTEILASWNGDGPDAIAIAADTGSGKTEAAALPLIAAALADALDGIRGTRAILAYPRVRLAANQAQRLAGYLAALACDKALPPLTLGLQVADVPQNFAPIGSYLAESWRPAGPGAFTFPFFGCPKCGEGLRLRPGEGVAGADLLACTGCDWRFAGWIGSKQGLRENPPSLFLPTTDSLHQWMHNPEYGRMFGDDAQYAAPRALLADEIHLYTHVHGAQVGLTLQRLAARSRTASTGRPPILSIGMSATIADPARAWGRLIGRSEIAVIRPGPEDTTPNVRGREYFYFIQPEVESRGADIAGASTTIQALMCLGHGVRRRTGREGGYRALVFFDSIDKMRRLHSAFTDAEKNLKLAAFRTADYGNDATGAPQTECCGEPVGCDRFADGECWWFGARDTRQCGARGQLRAGESLRVASMPIYSGTGGNAEKLIKESDVVFATSSLEVGYDDPDITLVYQHYAPLNLASFIQRKGRGGRGADDRPSTAVTLSIYSPRDSWWFRRPAEMVAPAGFDTPINPGNAYVRRAQALSALLDGLARRQRRTGAVSIKALCTADALAEAGVLVEAAFGKGIWAELDVADARELWTRATGFADLGRCRSLPEVRSAIEWTPNFLFETINLPTLRVTGEDVTGGDREDIALALATLAPGNATRRYHGQAVHWTRPAPGRQPWLGADDYREADFQALRSDPASLLGELPMEVRDKLADIEPALCRPRTVTVERLGGLVGTQWSGAVSYHPDRTPHLACAQGQEVTVRHESRGELNGFLLVEADHSAACALESEAMPHIANAKLYRSGLARDQASGLRVARVYWGADAELRFDSPQAESQAYSQTFVHPQSGRPLLHGYDVTTEGVRFDLDRSRLDAVVDRTMEIMEDDEAERRWRSAQFMRYLLESKARGIGVNAYEAKRAADVFVAAAGDAELRPELIRLKRFWGKPQICALFEQTRRKVLSQHPLMTEARVARTAGEIATPAFRELFVQSLDEVGNPDAMRGYIRSVIVHSLALRSRIWAAFVGSGDEGRMFAHARLPIQFGDDAQDIITIAEAGSYGDGTVRALAEDWPRAISLWNGGFIDQCPNATEDAALRRFWTQRNRHEHWRGLNGRDPSVLRRIAQDLGFAEGQLPAAIVRILFGIENVGAETFALYDVASEIEACRGRAIARMRRDPTEWELASAAVKDARDGSAVELARLLGAYGGLGESVEESFSPEARLADQTFRLGAPLCHDGCRACVHQSSDLMGDSLVQSSTSRMLLSRYFRG